MRKYLPLIIVLVLLSFAGIAFASPSTVDRLTDHIEPLIKTDYIKSQYFVATSTTATSTFANSINLTGGCFAINGNCIGGSGFWTRFNTSGIRPATSTDTVLVGGTATTTAATSIFHVLGTSYLSGNLGIGIQPGSRGITLSGSALVPGITLTNTGTGGNTYNIRSTDDSDSAGAGSLVVGGISNLLTLTSAGRLGIGEDAPGSRLAVSGSQTIGATYDTTAAPTNGLLVEGNTGVGTTTPGAKIHALSTTEQLRLGYDSLNFNSLTTSSVGGLTVTSTGTNGNITFVPSGTGSVVVPAGSATNPGLTFTGETTGLRLRSAGRIRMVMTGQPYIDYWSGGITQTSSGMYGWAVSTDPVAANDTALARNAAGIVEVNNGTAGTLRDITVRSASTTGQTVFATGGGNVGIGTTSPFAKFSIHGNANQTYVPSLLTIASSTPTATTTLFTVLSGGNVGIATSSPYAKLSVTNTGTGRTAVFEDSTNDATPIFFDADGNAFFQRYTVFGGSSVADSNWPNHFVADGTVGINGFAGRFASGADFGMFYVVKQDNSRGLTIGYGKANQAFDTNPGHAFIQSGGALTDPATFYINDGYGNLSYLMGAAWGGDTRIGYTDKDATSEYRLEVVGEGSCSGTASDCSGFSADQGTCEAQSGCSWEDPDCTGTPTACGDSPVADTQGACEAQGGCSWSFNGNAFEAYGGLSTFVSAGTTTVMIDSDVSKGACMKWKDTDGTGYTYVRANNGVLTATTVACN